MREFRELSNLGFDGYYVDDSGSVWSAWLKSGRKADDMRMLTPDATKRGYLRVRLRVCNGQYRRVMVHHLVLGAFVEPRPSGKDGLHWNGIVTDNRLCNLRWGTKHENEEDKRRHGTHQTGSGNPAAKLSEGDIPVIRKMHADGVRRGVIAKHYGLNPHHVSDIIAGKAWSHV